MSVLWEDREVRFDVSAAQMKMRSGENLIDTLHSVEDTKGNSGDRGRLLITNLRLIWHSQTLPRINLSIGYNSIVNITVKQTGSIMMENAVNFIFFGGRHQEAVCGQNAFVATTFDGGHYKPGKEVRSKLRGMTEALFLLNKSGGTRYEFVFANLVPNNQRLFTSVTGVHKSYNSSRMYREMKLRGAILSNRQLLLLPREQIVLRVNGVWNLTADQGNLGTFIITNVRVVWHANMNQQFNVSVPFLQIDSVRTRDSKFGKALVMESAESSGGYVLGFRIDPAEQLDTVYRCIHSLHQVYGEHPEFGVEYVLDSDASTVMSPDTRAPSDGSPTPAHISSTSELDDAAHVDTYTAYFADGTHLQDRDPVYNGDLGLAVEQLKEGFTLASLWEVVPK